ncbi:hypothetical protein Tsp_02935 [Trichinella spiralis]|uniref:hypothetical protein n=1 Tax=Trichinella spiralis TaxID=6334 RepID=UPI0001EFCDA9|nr:hypothetical protein Tsp_02935 [Trichinella spiralis]
MGIAVLFIIVGQAVGDVGETKLVFSGPPVQLAAPGIVLGADRVEGAGNFASHGTAQPAERHCPGKVAAVERRLQLADRYSQHIELSVVPGFSGVRRADELIESFSAGQQRAHVLSDCPGAQLEVNFERTVVIIVELQSFVVGFQTFVVSYPVRIADVSAHGGELVDRGVSLFRVHPAQPAHAFLIGVAQLFN